MKLSVAEAAEQLPELVRRAEKGDEVVLTRDGRDVVRFELIANDEKAPDLAQRRAAALQRFIDAAKDRVPDGGPDAAPSQDFLYDEYGIPK